MLTFEKPFYHLLADASIAVAVVSGTLPKKPEPGHCNDNDLEFLWGLSMMCWDCDPTKRPTAPNLHRDLRNREMDNTQKRKRSAGTDEPEQMDEPSGRPSSRGRS